MSQKIKNCWSEEKSDKLTAPVPAGISVPFEGGLVSNLLVDSMSYSDPSNKFLVCLCNLEFVSSKCN